MPTYPLYPRPFLPLRLAPHECMEYEATAAAVLRETLDEYHHFVHKQQRKMNKKRWKAVKTRENVTVYKKRDREDVIALRSGSSSSREKSTASDSSDSSFDKGGVPSASAIIDWQLPKLLGVGTIVGTLEDVMYGSISPDNDSLKIISSYIEDELVDGDVLYTFKTATHDDPFQFLGIQWSVKAHSATIDTFVKPRDVVYLEGTGLITDPRTGENLGYHLMHSVTPAECPPLTSQGILRAMFSSCYLFRQQANGAVEVYMKAFLDPAGSLPDAIGVMTSAAGLISTWKSMWCSHNRKLTWLLKEAVEKRTKQGDDGSAKVKTNARNKQCCALCTQAFGTFRRPVVCELCRAVVCSKCRIVRKLVYAQGHDLVKVPTAFCTTCITVATNADATEIARHEYVYGQPLARWDHAAPPSVRYTESLDGTMDEYGRDTDLVSDVDTIDNWEAQHRMPYEYMRPSVVPIGEEPEVVHGIAVHDNHALLQGNRGRAESNAQRQYELWMQMNQLRLQAEEAFNTAQSNTRAMYDANRARRPF